MMDEFNISERTLYRDLNRLGDRIVPDEMVFIFRLR